MILHPAWAKRSRVAFSRLPLGIPSFNMLSIRLSKKFGVAIIPESAGEIMLSRALSFGLVDFDD